MRAMTRLTLALVLIAGASACDAVGQGPRSGAREATEAESDRRTNPAEQTSPAGRNNPDPQARSATARSRTTGPAKRARHAAQPGVPVSLERIKQEPELGQVRWRRDYDAARAEARERGRPLFVLFQEVPG